MLLHMENEGGVVMSFASLFGPPLKCDICHKEKLDVRYADLIGKWICSDCMGVKEFEEVS